MLGRSDFDASTMQGSLQDASGNILPEREQMKADAYWRYFEKYHVPKLITEIMSKMMDSGQLPPPGLEEMAFGAGETNEETEDDLESGFGGDDEPDGDSLGERGDSEGGEVPAEGGEGETTYLTEGWEDEEGAPEEGEEVEEEDNMEKTKNYQAELPKEVTKQIEDLKKQLAEAQRVNTAHQVRRELSSIVNYQLDPDLEGELVNVLADLGEAQRKVVIASLEKLVPSQATPDKVESLGANLYQGDATPKSVRKMGHSVSEAIRIGEIMEERGISYREAAKIFEKEQK